MGADVRVYLVSPEQWSSCEPALPITVSDDVIDTANRGEFSSFEDLAEPATSLDRQAHRTMNDVINVKKE